MLRFLLGGLAAATVLACSQAPAPPPAARVRAVPAAEQLAQLTERYWDESQRLNPPSRSARVRFEPAAGYDISPQFLADSLDLERRYRDALLAVPRGELDAESQLTYDIFKRERDMAIEDFTYPSELMPVNPFRSVPLDFARAGAGVGPYAILSAKDYDSWRVRAGDYVRWTAQAIANLREGLRRGYVLPRVLVARMLPVLAELGADTPSNVFYRPLAAIPPSVRPEERRRFSDGIATGVKEQILPAYRRLHDFLRDEYLPRARQSIALSALPLGPAWYAHLVRRETASRMAPADIHAIGVAETERLHGRLQSLLAEAGFAGNAQAYLEAAQREPLGGNPLGGNPPGGGPPGGAPPIAYKTPEELLDFYAALKVSAAAAVATEFAESPQADFLIRAVEPSQAGGALSAGGVLAVFYERAANRSAAPVLYVDTVTQPLIPRTADFLREALPGHHLQLAVQQERSGLPSFRRFGGDPGFVDGWGIYAESLGEELGLYRDTLAKFASLRDQLACAAGLVVDTGVHGLGWSREQALEYLRAHVPMSETAANAAVDRVIALPAEALDCGMGFRAFKGLRAHAEQVLGARFDLRDFHSELIDDGAMPLDILESAANRWLNARH
jgi:uncharacterized protein (DUF885 family)